MQHLSPLDAAFLELDDEHSAVHIGGIAVFEGPVPSQADVENLYRRRLHALPRSRQRMRSVPFGLDWPAWVDDRAFDLNYHLRRTALPGPGGDAELETLVGRIFSQRLDLSRPPWEAWVVEGIAEQRWALIIKMHHSMADGMTGMAHVTGLFDGPVRPRHPRRAGLERSPGSARLVGAAVLHRASIAGRAARGIPSSTAHPIRTAGTFLAATRGALAFAAVLVDLPVDFADPGSAYGATVVRARAAKASHEIDAGELTVTVAGYLPPALTARTLHVAFRIPQQALTTVVTNVPGPAAPARILGRPLVALYPYVPIANRIRIGVAVTTYRDRLFLGVTCDRASVSDSDVFVDGIHSGVADLVKAAATARGAP